MQNGNHGNMEGHPTWNNGRTPQTRDRGRCSRRKTRRAAVRWGGGANVTGARMAAPESFRRVLERKARRDLAVGRHRLTAWEGQGLATMQGGEVGFPRLWPRSPADGHGRGRHALVGKPLRHIPVRRSARRWETPRDGGPFPCGRRLLPVPRAVWAELPQTDQGKRI